MASMPILLEGFPRGLVSFVFDSSDIHIFVGL